MFYKTWAHFTVTCGADKIHLFPDHVTPAHACFLAGRRCKAVLGEGRPLASTHHVDCSDARSHALLKSYKCNMWC